MFCSNCPRCCPKMKFCQAPVEFKIDLHQLHFGEEPCLSGSRGSGTIFFSHCNLKCVFCQNYQISQLYFGKTYSDEAFIKICFALKEEGAHNINLVSPTCYHYRLVRVLKELKSLNFSLPIIWNSNAYESLENIRTLKGLVDIYLPDFKYIDDQLAMKYSQAPNYFKVAQAAILEMASQQPKFNLKKGILKNGLIIRHLILPNHLDNSKNVLKWIRDNLGENTKLSLMSQYTPLYKASLFPEINRALTREEYEDIYQSCLDLGFSDFYIQNLSSAGEEMVPEFK